ncbi:MAG: AAA family ATPase [Elusimicrobia bacterium]|nr:AAA family ATPase [Elusimicrobiota bacterium]
MFNGKIIAIVNQKGGVGKTTTAINLSTSLAEYGQKTLLIDLDPQANTTSGLGFDKNALEKDIYQVMLEQIPLSSAILQTNIQNLSIIPSTIHLVGAELELINIPERELKLKKILSQSEGIYSYILIDCPPSLGLLTVNALCAADSVIIPIQCEYFAMEGLSQLLKTLELIQNNFNPSLVIEGVLLTMFDSRVNLSGQVINEIKKYFGESLFNTIVPRNIRLAEAPSFGKPVLNYDKSSKGAQVYLDLANELMELNKGWERNNQPGSQIQDQMVHKEDHKEEEVYHA